MEPPEEEELLQFVACRPNRAGYALHSTDVDDVSFTDIEKLLNRIECVEGDLQRQEDR